MISVTIPPRLLDFVREERFWDCFSLSWTVPWDDPIHARYELPPEEAIHMRFPSGHVLLVNASDSGLFAALQSPDGSEPILMGWDDGACPVPSCLRWSELDLICRAASLHDPSLRHPGILVALMARLAPITNEEDADRAIPLLESAYRSLFAPSKAKIESLIKRVDRRMAGYSWGRDGEYGWSIQQAQSERDRMNFPLHSSRGPGGGFPNDAFREAFLSLESAFARCRQARWFRSNEVAIVAVAEALAQPSPKARRSTLRTLLERAGCPFPAMLEALASDDRIQPLWVLEVLLALEPGALFRRILGPTSHGAISTVPLSIEIPRESDLVDVNAIVDALNRALSKRKTGKVRRAGLCFSEQQVEAEMLAINVQGNFDALLTLIVDVLHEQNAPGSTTLSWPSANGTETQTLLESGPRS